MAVTPVTNSQYRAYLLATGEEPPPFLDEPGFRELDQPVVGVSFDQATRYCEWLGRETGLAIRLPTEAEREKAARGGLEGAVFPWGDDPESGGHRTIRGPLPGPDRVRSTPPNGNGLYHMGDTVHEWCRDVYVPDYYASAPSMDPCAEGEGERRSARGGSWRHAIVVTACAARSCLPPSFHYADFGFRWVSEK
jgi:formylglycine-generating enzyme required for sulfatase activity